MQKAQNPSNSFLKEYAELIKTVARVEYARLSHSAHLLEFSELINIGTTAVYVVLTSQPETYHNDSYMSTAIKWAIRNELRRRYRWYSLKSSSKESAFPETSKEELREAVYETILSIDELEQAERSIQVEDSDLNPEQKIELHELKKAVQESMKDLSTKERIVLESKFFKNRKIKDIADEMGVSSSRISKIMKGALDKIKVDLLKKGII